MATKVPSCQILQSAFTLTTSSNPNLRQSQIFSYSFGISRMSHKSNSRIMKTSWRLLFHTFCSFNSWLQSPIWRILNNFILVSGLAYLLFSFPYFKFSFSVWKIFINLYSSFLFIFSDVVSLLMSTLKIFILSSTVLSFHTLYLFFFPLVPSLCWITLHLKTFYLSTRVFNILSSVFRNSDDFVIKEQFCYFFFNFQLSFISESQTYWTK